MPTSYAVFDSTIHELVVTHANMCEMHPRIADWDTSRVTDMHKLFLCFGKCFLLGWRPELVGRIGRH